MLLGPLVQGYSPLSVELTGLPRLGHRMRIKLCMPD